MAISARTFQVLYIIRQRALDDQATKLEDFAPFISARRATAPGHYSRAYLAPSDLTQRLTRMTTGEGLLMIDPDTKEYEFTARGSQMADLLDGLDACSVEFLDNYKAKVSLAVLQQRQRLGQDPATPREVAAISGISRDSASRGLLACAEKGLCMESRTDRTRLYSCGPTATPVVATTPVATPKPLGGLIIEDFSKILAKDSATDNLPKGVTEADIEAAARIPLEKDEDLASMLAGINNDEGFLQALPKTQDDLPEQDELPLSLSGILSDDGPDSDDPVAPAPSSEPFPRQTPFVVTPPPVETEEPEEAEEPMYLYGVGRSDDMEATPYDWGNVPAEVLEGFVIRAKAAGLSLVGFLTALNEKHEQQVREVLLGESCGACGGFHD